MQKITSIFLHDDPNLKDRLPLTLFIVLEYETLFIVLEYETFISWKPFFRTVDMNTMIRIEDPELDKAEEEFEKLLNVNDE